MTLFFPLKVRTTSTADNVKIVQCVDLTIISYFVIYKANLSIALTLISGLLSAHDLLNISCVVIKLYANMGEK